MTIAVRHGDVFLAVDLQYDFMPGGSLAVAGGFEILPLINEVGGRFPNVVLTQDWHPPGHSSFASTYEGAKPYEVMAMPYGPQILWPDHCVWNTRGAEIAEELDLPHAQMTIRKGYRQIVDSYSGFREADRETPTGLEGYLKERGIRRLFIAGLATDFCVNWTAVDAAAAGFQVFVMEDLCRAIDTQGSLARAWNDMTEAGVVRIQSSEID